MRAAAALLLGLVLLWAAVALANDALAPLQVHLYAGGLFVAGPAFAWPTPAAGAAVFLAGCLCDAGSPAGLFGVQTALFCAAYLALRALRGRLPAESAPARTAAALAINLAFFLALSALRAGRFPAPADAALRLLADLAASEAFVALAAPWFLALEERALELTGAAPGRRARPD